MTIYQYPDYMYHYGVKGMKWGVRKSSGYKSTSLKARKAKRANDKVDESFKKWNDNAEKKANAITLGKDMNSKKLAYESNKSKETKTAYKNSKKAYNKALRSNTTYRKGAIKGEVGKDASRKYLSAAKKVKKQLDSNPNDKNLQKQYDSLMSKHDVARADARRAPEVGAQRSVKKASLKRKTTMGVRTVATTAAVVGGAYAVSKATGIDTTTLLNGSDSVLKFAKFGKKILSYVY